MAVGLVVDAHGPRVAVAAGLFFIGLGVGVWDVSMNLEGADVERHLGTSVMPHFHAAFSGGTVLSALLGSAMSWARVPLTVVVNPEIRFLTEERIAIWEGCLSVPDLRGQVPRIAHVELSALDRHGRPQRLELRGFPAAVVQHECDHLDGVLYLDRVEDTTTLSFLREFQRYRATEFAAD